MKAILFSCILCLSLCTLQAFSQISGFVVQEKKLPSFKTLIVDLPVNVEIDGAKASQGVLVASQADIAKISWEVKEEALIITAAEGAVLEGSINLSLGSSDLSRIESTGDAIIYMHHIDKEILTLDVFSGAVKLEGEVNRLQLMVEKAKVYANDLKARSAVVNVWDEGSIILHASEKLEVDATNNGKVIYSGQPNDIQKSATNGALIISHEEQNTRYVEYIDVGV